MTDPIRNDVFEDANGVRVAVKQTYPPNALGVILVEYKNLSDSNLRFMPKEQFLECFHWVDNFGSTDTFVKVVNKKAEQLPQEEKSEKKDDPAAEPQADEAIESSPQDDALGSAAPTRSS
jgi:hypothetical protein